jgi:hypothetical protein
VEWHKTGIIGAICYQNATKTKWVQGAEPWGAQPNFREETTCFVSLENGEGQAASRTHAVASASSNAFFPALDWQ